MLKRLKSNVALTEHEMLISSDIIDPADLNISWSDIGGLTDIITSLQESVVLPFTRPDIFHDTALLLRAPSGILLHGAPGCGKTMLAMALAKECGCCFIR